MEKTRSRNDRALCLRQSSLLHLRRPVDPTLYHKLGRLQSLGHKRGRTAVQFMQREP